MKPINSLLATLLLTLCCAEGLAYMPRYWRRTQSEKIMDKVYKNRGKQFSQGRKYWRSLRKNFYYRKGRKVYRTTREWVPRDRCLRTRSVDGASLNRQAHEVLSGCQRRDCRWSCTQ